MLSPATSHGLRSVSLAAKFRRILHFIRPFQECLFKILKPSHLSSRTLLSFPAALRLPSRTSTSRSVLSRGPPFLRFAERAHLTHCIGEFHGQSVPGDSKPQDKTKPLCTPSSHPADTALIHSRQYSSRKVLYSCCCCCCCAVVTMSGGSDPDAWLGLLKWSLAHQDGTAPSEARPMSDEVRPCRT